jgi:hypothetical protein
MKHSEKEPLHTIIVQDEGDILTAIFPTVAFSNRNDVTVYDSVSGHSSGTKDWYKTTKKPERNERYTYFVNHIQSIYEDVEIKVVEKWLNKYDTERYEDYRSKCMSEYN